MKEQGGFWSRPWFDYLRLLQALTSDFHVTWLVMMFAGLVAAWWIYVPLHELMHAWGCLLAGGEVSRLEISPEYGAAWLQDYFPYVVVGSEYAGQLVDFDTRGSDWIYVATVYAPYLLTIYPGIPLFHAMLNRPWPSAMQHLGIGLALPLVIAPFVSLLGDFYELGSIAASQLGQAFFLGHDTLRWRSDDLLLLVGEITPTANWRDWAGIALGFLFGIVFAWATYALGVFFRPRPKAKTFGRG